MTKGVPTSGKGSTAKGQMPGGDKKQAGSGGNSDESRVTSGLPTGGSKGGSSK
ncbi:hypothetical protein LCM17_08380 [Cereibacter sphaeroides]|nr:hypothetical protein [Cereibacter sphaeroides]